MDEAIENFFHDEFLFQALRHSTFSKGRKLAALWFNQKIIDHVYKEVDSDLVCLGADRIVDLEKNQWRMRADDG